ncbi:MAG: 4-(cytidine 5'-diphospho)-2-C-methyl-D-erythritol kinase [Pseudomonadota bacterium]|nr:4-(cytidine 5'-diphospho)-2-C-methyl-D-erythritol kinase [Pseudomonadota bacterium]
MPIVDSWLWPAPSKINLFLHVTGRRADGFHLLQTAFQLLDLCDSITIQVSDSGRIGRSGGLPGLTAEADLAVRAAQLLKHATGCTRGAEIDIHKRIPAGAGLGGGSSDAATVLVALNAMWDTQLKVDQLAELGLTLGADVPVFVHGHTAWAEGVGEVLTAIETEDNWYVVVFPEETVSTAIVFSDLALTHTTPRTTIPRLLSRACGSGMGGFLSDPNFHNDLQALVESRYPPVASASKWLSGFGVARMSGSGASVFAAFAHHAEAQAVARQCPQGWSVFVAKAVSQSPLLSAVQAWHEQVRNG